MEPAKPSHLIFFDPDSHHYESYKIPIVPHSIVQNGDRPEVLYLISKWNTQIAVFRRDLNQVEKVFEVGHGRRAFGHGVWDSQRKGFWYTENDDLAKKGYLVLLDENLTEMDRIGTNGSWPHEVQWGKSGDLLVANSLGEGEDKTPSFVSVDPQTKKVIRKIPLQELSGKGIVTHFVQSQTDNRVYLGGLKLELPPSHVVEIDPSGVPHLLPVNDPDFTGESISLCLDEQRNILTWVHYSTGAYFVYDLKSRTVLEKRKDKNFASILKDQDRYIMTSKAEDSVYLKEGAELKNAVTIQSPEEGSFWNVHINQLVRKS